MITKKQLLPLEEFDFAFSFAGKDRGIVEEIYDQLSGKGYRIFYDLTYQAQLVGHNLYSGLRDLYKNKGRYVVCFISENYTKTIWTALEFTAIKERLMTTFFAGDFLIPIFIDKAEPLIDIPNFIGFYQHESIDKTVQLLQTKIDYSIIEDNFFQNIHNCMSYICTQVYNNLYNKYREVKKTGEYNLEIVGTYKCLHLSFSADNTGSAPCILVYSGSHIDEMPPFPTLIVTWKREENLKFIIHSFEEKITDLMNDYSLHQVIHYIGTYIERILGD